MLLLIRNKVSSFKLGPFFQEIETLNAISALFDVARQIKPLFKQQRDHPFLFTTSFTLNKYEWTSHLITQSVFQPREDVSKTACKQNVT